MRSLTIAVSMEEAIQGKKASTHHAPPPDILKRTRSVQPEMMSMFEDSLENDLKMQEAAKGRKRGRSSRLGREADRPLDMEDIVGILRELNEIKSRIAFQFPDLDKYTSQNTSCSDELPGSVNSDENGSQREPNTNPSPQLDQRRSSRAMKASFVCDALSLLTAHRDSSLFRTPSTTVVSDVPEPRL
eukprot:754202-Hanusia_phi.AAC.4